ncbi:MAG: peptidoglycan-binding protein [Rhizobium sp.]|nr:MAG: peptidoglycan-binding protein [Rhizobium sp.]
MAPQKRKSPKGRGKGKRKQPGLASRGAVALGSLSLRGSTALGGLGVRGVGALAGVIGGAVGRNPAIAGGVALFLGIFGFVTANALWYQTGTHPSPMLRTRDPASPYQIPGRKSFLHAQQADAGNVTTFRIERQDSMPNPADAAVGGQTANSPAAQPPAAPSRLVADIQAELIRHGLYDGVADGRPGSRTTSAILFFQEASGLAQTGTPTPELLAALKASNATGTQPAGARTNTAAAAVPAERPVNVSATANAIDPVAAAIQNAEKNLRTGAVVAKATPNDAVTKLNMVMQIQKGLTNIAYSNVSIDGVAGEQTKAAIRRFQKHYRLPETGEPSMAVLKKLQDIGAL